MSNLFTEEWSALDGAADANLRPSDLRHFHAYKEELIRDRHAWNNDAEDILTGYIWGQVEMYGVEEMRETEGEEWDA